MGLARYPMSLGKNLHGGDAVRVLIGPSNMAGQGFEWATALSNFARVRAEAVSIRRLSSIPFRVDGFIDANQASVSKWVTGRSHLLLEGALWIDGSKPPPDTLKKYIESYRTAGRELFLLFHGSDVRHPDLHTELNPDSLFRDLPEERVAELRRRVCYSRTAAEYLGLPAVYSTPDLSSYCSDNASWVPLVVDQAWREARLKHDASNKKPIVLHCPSSSEMKGSARIVPILENWQRRGRISLRLRTGVSRQRMLQEMSEADIFVDQLGIGGLGVASLEALALGKPLVSHAGTPTLETYLDRGIELAMHDIVNGDLETALTNAMDEVTYQAGSLALSRKDSISSMHDGELTSLELCKALDLSPRLDRTNGTAPEVYHEMH